MRMSVMPPDTERTVVRLVRITSLVSISVGVLSLLANASGAPAAVLLTPPDALGLLFIGFAIRLSRLADYRLAYRVMFNTCRVSLLLLGAAGVFSSPSRFASGISFFFAGVILLLRRRYVASVTANRLCAALIVYVCACWVGLVLFLAQIAPLPWPLLMHPLLLVFLSAAAIGLSAFTRNPGIVQLIVGRGLESDVARNLFAASLAIPVTVAILIHFAEDAGWLWSGHRVLMQVLVSVACMVAVSRLQSLRVFDLRRTADAMNSSSSQHERMYRQILDSLDDPVWIFDRDGRLSFLNNSARSFNSPGDNGWESVLNRQQQHSVLNAALFGYRHPELVLRDAVSGDTRHLPVRFLGVFNSELDAPEQIVLVAHSPVATPASPGLQ